MDWDALRQFDAVIPQCISSMQQLEVLLHMAA